jgi:hypothetical protein
LLSTVSAPQLPFQTPRYEVCHRLPAASSGGATVDSAFAAIANTLSWFQIFDLLGETVSMGSRDLSGRRVKCVNIFGSMQQIGNIAVKP